MKKRYHLRSDGEVAEASIAERIGCLLVILASIILMIVGIHKVMHAVIKFF